MEYNEKSKTKKVLAPFEMSKKKACASGSTVMKLFLTMSHMLSSLVFLKHSGKLHVFQYRRGKIGLQGWTTHLGNKKKRKRRIDRETEKPHATPHRSDCRLGWGLGVNTCVNPLAQACSPQINVYKNSTYNRLDLQKHSLKDA